MQIVSSRPCVAGKFIYIDDEKLYIRGVTYGTFAPNEAGNEYPAQDVVEHDFARMAATGLNAIRVYTVPPRCLLDAAQRHGLYVMVGLPWEQHVTFLDDRAQIRSIEERVRDGVRSCAGHPAVLCYAIGNEIPSSIVRWYGRRRVERFLKRLYRIAKHEDPRALFTYVNYPSTEYLQVPFVDFVCCNLYLEAREKLEAYLARLHNLAGERPLVLGEIGLDSQRNGLEVQATILDWQVRTAFAAGCAGTFVFAWTDEWHRTEPILDWDFGLTDRARRPKPALVAVRAAFAEALAAAGSIWPRISVVVCSYNGERVIHDCCEGLRRLAYPDYEVIVVVDGSTDRTAAIARSYGFRVITTPNRGLSAARNTGLEAATGTVVAYLDDDAYPDPHWLTYLAFTFLTTDCAGVGGPNIPPPGDGSIAECVANAPGGPIHILLSDREAEHIPGCNMAFRKDYLEAIGGFDPQFRVAGDDVDVCWRLQQQGWTLGFHPAAVVWHHRRDSLRAYWRQQLGYGRAEALLERKWPEKYNAAGHVTWTGRLYGRGLTRTLGWRRERIIYGTWGTAPFQPAYDPAPGLLPSLPLMPEWHILSAGLGVLALLGLQWEPLLLALPLLVVSLSASLVQALASATHARYSVAPRSSLHHLKLRALTAYLHLAQPFARLVGRRWSGMAIGMRGGRDVAWPWPEVFTIWSVRWQPPEAWLYSVERALRTDHAVVRRGSDCDRWDLEVRVGPFAGTRIRMASEEHGAGRQLIRFRIWPRTSPYAIGLMILVGVLCGVATYNQAWIVSAAFGAIALVLALRSVQCCAAAHATALRALRLVKTQRDKAARSSVPFAAAPVGLLHQRDVASSD